MFIRHIHTKVNKLMWGLQFKLTAALTVVGKYQADESAKTEPKHNICEPQNETKSGWNAHIL